MSENQELQVQQKREVDKKTEGTAPGRTFLPVTDIFETPDALTVVLEMPGVTPNHRSQANNRIKPAGLGHCTRNKRNFERPRYPQHIHIFFTDTMGSQRVHAGIY